METKKFKFRYIVALLLVFLVVYFQFRKNQYFDSVGDPLPVGVYNERTEKTDTVYVQVYKTTEKMTYREIFRRLPGNRIYSFMFDYIPSRKEAPIVFRYSYPEYRRFLMPAMIKGTLFAEAGIIRNFFQYSAWHSDAFFLRETGDKLNEKGTVVIMRCRKPWKWNKK